MGSVARTLLFTSLLATGVLAQIDCYEDADCMENQYCYSTNLCANFTVCRRYNRLESTKPARQPSHCGPCLEGYSADTILGPDGEAEKCSKNPIGKQQDTSDSTISKWVYVPPAISTIVIIVFVLHCIWHRCKRPCKDRTPPEKSPQNLRMIEMGNGRPSAPPLPPTRSQNNNKYDDAEETNPLTTIRENRSDLVVDNDQLNKAQPFYPPHNVRVDPSYNPGDNPDDQATSPPLDVDEETIPDHWTPGPPIQVVSRAFQAITEEQVDNSTNAARDRICPSPSANHNGGDNGQGSNGTTGNAGGNLNVFIRNSMQFQFVNTNNQGSNGS